MSFRLIAARLGGPVALAILVSSPGLTQPSAGPTPASLGTASLEDLMNIQVTSVSRKEQTLSKTAAAVYVISQDDIRRSGATNIPDILRLAPGVEVAQIDANTWAISIRGLNDRYAKSVLVLIDGRTVYSPTTSGVYWDELDVPFEDIDRIEITRGPGGTVWGANAMNGVINIITTRAEAKPQSVVAAGGGSQGRAQALFQHEDAIGQSGAYRVFGEYSNQGNLTASNSQSAAADGWHMMHGGFRSDWNLSPTNSLTVQGDYIQTGEGQTINSVFSNQLPLERVFNDPVTVGAGNILTRWSHKLANGSDTSLQAYFDRTNRLDLGQREVLNTADVDFQDHIRIGVRNDVVWGAGYRATFENDTAGYALTFVPLSRTTNLFSTFVQDEIALGRSVWFTAGSKLEHNSYSGFEYEPGAKLLWQATEQQTFWISAARAIRQPNRLEDDILGDLYVFPTQGGGFGVGQITGSPTDPTAAVMYDFEAGYRAQLGKQFSADFATFDSYYRNLENLIPGTPFFTTDEGPPHVVLPLLLLDVSRAHTYGAEVFGTWTATSHWKLSPSISAIQLATSDNDGGIAVLETTDATPQFQAQLRSSVDLTKHLDWDVTAWHIGRLRNGGEGDIPAYNRLDTRLGWRFGEHAEIAVVGQNLLTRLHPEFDTAYQVQRTLVERSVFAKVTLRF